MKFLKNLFGRKTEQYQQSIQAAVRRKTTGRVGAKVISVQHGVDQRIMQTASRGLSVLDGKSPFHKQPTPTSKPGSYPNHQAAHHPPPRGQVIVPPPASYPMAPHGYPYPYPPPPAGYGYIYPEHPHPQMFESPPVLKDVKTKCIDLSALGSKSRRLIGWLVATSGAHVWQDFQLYVGTTVIGTAADCNVVITDVYISPQHLRIDYDKSKKALIATDLNSKNGTFVNQKCIKHEAQLVDNDTIRLGKTKFKFKALE